MHQKASAAIGVCPIRPQQSGLSLLEMILTLSIMAILVAITVDGFRPLLQRSSGARAMMALADSIGLARAAAARHQATVTLCSSADGQSCGGQWQQGYMLFIDQDENRRLEPAAGDRLLLWHDSNGQGGSLSFGRRHFLQVKPQGRTAHNGTFIYCPADGDLRGAAGLIINNTARLRFASDSDGDGIAEASDGRTPLSCAE